MSDDLSRAVIEEITATLEESGRPVPHMAPSTSFTDGSLPLDSLDFAVVVVRLEKRLGCDPFNSSTLERFPSNIGELAEVYRQALATRPA